MEETDFGILESSLTCCSPQTVQRLLLLAILFSVRHSVSCHTVAVDRISGFSSRVRGSLTLCGKDDGHTRLPTIAVLKWQK